MIIIFSLKVGDAGIFHPFFSCASALDSARRHYSLQETGSPYQSLKKAYLAQWKAYGMERKTNSLKLSD